MAFTPFNPQRRRASFPPSTGEQPRVLYVEDEDLNWEITEKELAERCIIHRAVNSAEAFARLAKASYHVILMDIQLSGSELDGLSIARILKGTYHGQRPSYARYRNPTHEASDSAHDEICTTPIVFVTAYTARYRKKDLLDAGGEELISKPVSFTRLSLVISRIWARGTLQSTGV